MELGRIGGFGVPGGAPPNAGGSPGAGLISAMSIPFDRVLAQAEALRGGPGGPGGAPNDEKERIREAAASFEAFFLHFLLKGLRRTVPDGGLFEMSFAREVYEDMLDQETAQKMAEAGGIGLAEILYDQLAGGR